MTTGIRNKSSKLSTSESMGKIQQLLAESGATSVRIDYNNQSKPVSVSFLIMINHKPLEFRLSTNVNGLLEAMKRDKKVAKSLCNIEQAERTAWKNKLEWLELQMAEIKTGQANITELLLGYAVTSNGETAFKRITSGDTKLLGN